MNQKELLAVYNIIKIKNTKMKNVIKKIKKEGEQCSLCAAKLEIWVDNSKFSEERKEKINQHLLSYCPICARTDQK